MTNTYTIEIRNEGALAVDVPSSYSGKGFCWLIGRGERGGVLAPKVWGEEAFRFLVDVKDTEDVREGDQFVWMGEVVAVIRQGLVWPTESRFNGWVNESVNVF